MNDLLARLITAGTPADLVAEVAAALANVNAELEVLERRRTNERERKATWRKKSRDVTGQNVTGRTGRDNSPLEVSPHTPLPKTPSVSSLRSETNARIREGWPKDFREQFWARYPHKVGKPDALRKLEGVMRRGKVNFATVMTGLERYIAGKPADRAWCNPATWINQERWSDQPAMASETPVTTLTEGRTTWIRDDDPRWQILADRFLQERGRPISPSGSRNEHGLGWYFPNEWIAA